MIRIVGEGNYKLIETKAHTKILYLKHQSYAWIGIPANGEMLVRTNHPHPLSEVLAVGRYQVYSVVDEPELTDLTHLELQVGDGHWQGYLLPTGFPTLDKVRSKIIPTDELIHDRLIISPGHLATSVKKPSFLDVI